MNKSIHIRDCQPGEREVLTDFLYSLKEELLLPNRQAAGKIIDLLFEQGHLLAAYQHQKVIGLVGYMLGDPTDATSPKDIGFIYVCGIAKRHRKSMIFRDGLRYTAQQLKTLGVKEIRMQAAKSVAYTNRLYAHFATFQGESQSLRGHPTHVYAQDIDTLMAYLDSLAKREIKVLRQPTFQNLPLAA